MTGKHPADEGFGDEATTARSASAIRPPDPRTARPVTPAVPAPSSGIDLSPGTLLANHYRIGRLLGAGGMGVVVKAHDEQLDRFVAIKVIRPELLTDAETRENFLREARTMARIRHLNVVDVDYFGLSGDAPYFIMEYIPGTTLERWYREACWQMGGPPPVDEALGLIYQCCRGVSAIHKAGAIHGDIKPSNLLIGGGFRLVITDLGLARMLDGGNLEQVAGTPAYMAPEALDPTDDPELAMRRDVYSLGVLAYELLTGKLPFAIHGADDFYEVSRAQPPSLPSHLRVDLPASFDAAILRALSPDPRQRTPSADALRQELVRARREVATGEGTLRILVADDDDAFVAMVDTILHANFSGATVIAVPDGSQALDAVEHHPVDLAIVDLHMPEANGVTVTAAMRAVDPEHRTPIVVVTAEGGASDWRLLHGLGADAFLVKPFDPETLVSTVGRLLDNRPGTLIPRRGSTLPDGPLP